MASDEVLGSSSTGRWGRRHEHCRVHFVHKQRLSPLVKLFVPPGSVRCFTVPGLDLFTCMDVAQQKTAGPCQHDDGWRPPQLLQQQFQLALLQDYCWPAPSGTSLSTHTQSSSGSSPAAAA
jgi:hypothetical protein